MTMQPKRMLALLASVFLLFLVSACGPSTGSTGGSGGNNGSGGAGPKHLTVPELLQSSSDQMKKITSLHFTMGLSADVSYTTASTGAQQTSITLQGSGDEAGQNKVSMDMNMGIASQTIKLSEIILDSKLYVKNTKGQWYVMDKSASGASTLTGTQDYSKFLDLAKKAKYTDHGVETYAGEQLHHITYTFGKDFIQDVLGAMGQSDSLTPAVKQELNMFNVSQMSLDTYTDDATSYVHHIQMKMDLSLGANAQGTPVATGTPTSTSMSMKYTISMDLSNFNKPVTITAPSGALPASSITSIFS